MPCLDLHIHSYYSDGKFSPEEIVCHADELGLAAIAITDHDNTRGARQALPLARAIGIELVPAIEFTSCWPGCAEDVDVLGYFINLEDRVFRAFEQAALDDLHARIAECCARLTAQGCPLSFDDVLAENPRYAGLLQLTLAYQKKGYAPDWDSALRPVGQAWQAGRLSRFTITQVIEQIHRAGGVAVLAHPTVITFGDGWIKPAQLAALVEAGLDGLEIFHHRLDANAQTYFLNLARQFDLAVSGGSDEHGWHGGFKRMGTQPVTPDMLRSLRARCAA